LFFKFFCPAIHGSEIVRASACAIALVASVSVATFGASASPGAFGLKSIADALDSKFGADALGFDIELLLLLRILALLKLKFGFCVFRSGQRRKNRIKKCSFT